MPGFDGTGPRGMGPMTGGGRGLCNPNYAAYGMPYGGVPRYGMGFSQPYFYGRGVGFGRGMGRGRGRGGRGWGRGMGRGFGWQGAYPYVHPGMHPYGIVNPYDMEITPKEELEMLKSDAKVLNQQMKDIQERIETLEKAEAKEFN